MNAGFQTITLNEIAASTASHSATPISRESKVADRRAARAAVFVDCMENALTGLILLGCLLFAAAALRLGVPACTLRHWGVAGIYAVAVMVGGVTLSAVASDILTFRNSLR